MARQIQARGIDGLLGRVDLDRVLDTSNFAVDEGCIGCGLCERICPARAIVMAQRQPIWTNAKCFVCLGCVRSCPTRAITYGKRS